MQTVHKTINVDQSISTVYTQWTQFEKFPRFMSGVGEVRQLVAGKLHWKSDTPGKTREWDARVNIMNGTRYFDAGSLMPLLVVGTALAAVPQFHRPQENTTRKAEVAGNGQPMGKAQDRAEKVTDLIGKPVEDYQGTSMGRVENFMVDRATHKVVAVVISCVSWRGRADEWSAVPPTAVRFNLGRYGFQLDTTALARNQIPHFKPNDWPGVYQEVIPSGLGQCHPVRPYFNPVITASDRAQEEPAGPRWTFTLH